MSFEKRNKNLNSIKDIVLNNTNKNSLDELNAIGTTYEIKNFDKAFALIKSAINENKHIYVYADYDCDGVCSAIIWHSILDELFNLPSVAYTIKLPCRFNDGYGLSLSYCKDYIKENSLVITVDNGIAAVEQIKLLKNKNCDVLIMDHHLPRGDKVLPNADVIIDPEAIGNATFEGYCAAGLSLRFAEYCNKMIPTAPTDDTQILYCTMYAAIATIADVVPLVEDNRKIVQKGLNIINITKTTFLNSLFLQEGLEFVDETTVGFLIAPLINAMGRLRYKGAQELADAIYDMDRGWFYNPEQYINMLINNNEKRKKLCMNGEAFCSQIVQKEKLFRPINPIVVWEEKETGKDQLLHQGIVGIVAGRLTEEYKTPAFVLTETENGIFKGSARTYGDINIKEMLDEANEQGLLLSYGGHPAAAGLSCKKENLSKLRDFFISLYIKKGYTVDMTSYYDLEVKINNRHDAENIIKELKKYGPFGEGNPEPILLFKANLVPIDSKYYRLLGQDGEHIKLRASDIEIVGFGLADKYLKNEPKTIKILGTLATNIYMGESRPQFLMREFEELHSSLSPLATALQELLK